MRVEELSSKVDVTIMNQTRLNRSLLPAEKRIIRPSDLPALPVYTEDDLKAMERFLEDESNLSAMVSLRMFCIDFSRVIWSLSTQTYPKMMPLIFCIYSIHA